MHQSTQQSVTIAARSATHDYGQIQVSEVTREFGFRIVIAAPTPETSFLFALTSAQAPANCQLSIRIDVDTGEIWDMSHQAGIIGWIMPNLLNDIQSGKSVPLSWEMYLHNGAWTSRLQIGYAEWLYPSSRVSIHAIYKATCGYSTVSKQRSPQLSQGYVWCEDQIFEIHS